ncbi:MAG: XRE family transcriptional regulator [Pseudomonadota bacterium]
MAETNDHILKALPLRLKEARKTQGLSLDAVANLSGVSRSMVSQIERGQSSPTIATLWNLTRALNVDFAGLLEAKENQSTITVLKASQVPTIENMGTGCAISILSPPEEAGGHEVYDIRFEAKGTLTSAPHARGSMEQLAVLEGRVKVTSDIKSEEVGVGDIARYAADVPHAIAALNGPARIFLIVKPS